VRIPEGLRARLRGTWRPVFLVIAPVALLTVVAMVWLWPSGSSAPADDTHYVDGNVRTVLHAACTTDDEAAQAAGQQHCGTVVVRVTSGPDAGQEITTDVPSGPGAIQVREGEDVALLYLPDTPIGETYQIADHQRGSQLWVLLAAFALADKGTHGAAGRFDITALRTIKHRVEGAIRFLATLFRGASGR